ncbi:hypothetical protein D3C87_1856130 [compost metagenome]
MDLRASLSDCREGGKNDGEGALACRCSKNGGASHRTFNEQDQRGKFRLNRCGHVKVPVNDVGALFHAVSLSAPSQVAVDQNLFATDSNRCLWKALHKQRYAQISVMHSWIS